MHRMDKHKSFVFARQYINCFSRRINPLVRRNQPIKTAVGIVMHDFHGLNEDNELPQRCRHCLFLTCSYRDNPIFHAM